MNIQIESKRLVLKNYSKNDLANAHKLKFEPIIWNFSI